MEALEGEAVDHSIKEPPYDERCTELRENLPAPPFQGFLEPGS
jgi:hypothetical protein